MTDVLKPQRIEVRSESTLVVVQIGNAELKLHYEDALTLSQWIRFRAKEAKRAAGDTSRNWRTIGNLTALEHGENPFGKKWQ